MSNSEELKDKAVKHKAQSIHYYENALHFLEMGDAEKASEFLWGSMSQALKAFAAYAGKKLQSHDDIRRFALKLTKEVKNESIWLAFTSAQSLHSNFYETGLLLEDVIIGAEIIKKVASELLSQIPTDNEGQ